MDFDFKAQPEPIQKFIILGAVLMYHNLCHPNPATLSLMNAAENIMLDNNIPTSKVAKLLNDAMIEFNLVSNAEVEEAQIKHEKSNPYIDPYLN